MPPSKEQWAESFKEKWSGAGISYLMIDAVCDDIRKTLREQLTEILAEMPEELNVNGFTESHSHRGFYEKGHDESVRTIKSIIESRLQSLSE